MKNTFYALLFIIAQSQHGFAQEGTVSTKVGDVRDQNKMGVYLGLGTPYPSLIGINVGYNLSDLRLTAGYAELETTTSLSYSSTNGWTEEKAKASTYDLGTEYYFMRGQSFRPLVGIHIGYVDISGQGEISIEGFKKDSFHAYANVGIDYMSSSGYQFALGYNQGFISNGNGNVYFNTGRFF